MENRPTWNETFIEICETLSKRSTCAKLQTAALITRDNRIISIGYNGTPPGQEHCEDYWMNSMDFNNEHHEWSLKNELHGERNCILNAAKNGIPLNNTTMYSLYSPCINCAHDIYTCGISKVFYKYKYRRGQDGMDFLKKNNVSCTLL